MKQFISFLIIGIILISCKPEGVKKEEETIQAKEENQPMIDSLEMNLAIKDELTLKNGIEITWLEKTNGEPINDGDVILIDYKVRLKDSTIIDGNHLLNRKSLPYVVGFGFQPKGWDISLKELKVGDFARIKLPSELARGKQGVEGLIPDNADNYLTIRVLSKKKPTREVDGVKVWILEQSKKYTTIFNEKNTIVFHTSISSPSHPFYYNSFAKDQPFELKLEDQGVVPGLKKALINAKKGDRMFIVVPANQAYGAKGYQDVVKANEDLFYNLFVMDILD
jgi:FKBP-type peptidyl-prolyl cis-trans isomerase